MFINRLFIILGMLTTWPNSLDDAVKICLLTITAAEKSELKNTSVDNLIMSHFGWAVNMRNEFGMWQENTALIKSYNADNPDDASMDIVKEVWNVLNRH
jgi:hypothetical protein